jgi:ATP-dependent exoDNAse (exonuclease V) alpha subunit
LPDTESINDILAGVEPIPELEKYSVVPKHVRKLLKSGHNIMLHGAAGTGKSTILRAITRERKNCIVLSPTGIAALNVGGQTLHSFFGFSFGMINPAEVKGVPRNLKLLIEKPLIIIDEISMVRSDVFNAVDMSLRRTLGSKLPFAGLQVLLLGDTGQLPPIVTKDESEYFGPGKEMFFNSESYYNGRFKYVELDTVHRQSNLRFIDFLMRVRVRNVKSIDLEWFNSKIEVISTRKFFKRDDPDATVLCMTNARADEYNQTMFERLDTKPHVYEAIVTGRFSESEYPTHEALQLKVGAKVVLIRNAKDKSYVNGSIGEVTELLESSVMVNVRGRVLEVEPDTWEKYAYCDSPEGGFEKKVVGSFKQIPMRLAWAVTVHKSQGMTLRRFHLDLERAPFTHGQMYVALSRARSVKGITATREIMKSDIIVDPSKILK